MARPVITFNASTGSDTAASGAGPATAVSDVGGGGSGASGTSGTTSITFGSNIDVTGAAEDGTTAIYVASASGERHLFSVASFTGTFPTSVSGCTTNETIGATTFSDVAFGIGGKRKTLENDSTQPDWDDMGAGWTLEFEAGTYQISVSINPSTAADTTEGVLTFRSSDPGTVVPIIERASGFSDDFIAATAVAGQRLVFDGFKMQMGDGSEAGNYFYAESSACDSVVLRRCEFDGTGMRRGLQLGTDNRVVEDCVIHSFDQNNALPVHITNSGRSNIVFRRNVVRDVTGTNAQGINLNNSGNYSMCVVDRCLVYNVTANCIYVTMANTGQTNSITNCIMDRPGAGLSCLHVPTASPSLSTALIVENNVMSGYTSGGYGFEVVNAAAAVHVVSNRHNIYKANGGTHRLNIDAGEGDIETTDDLYTNTTPGSEDYTPASGSPMLGAALNGPSS